MKKNIMVLFGLLLLVGCTSAEQVVVCEKEFNDEQRIIRNISLYHTRNAVNKVVSVDEIYFDDVFTKEAYEQLVIDLESKLTGAKSLSYTIEELDDKIVITSTLVDIANAQANELTFIGMSPEISEDAIGLEETIAANEANDFTCSIQE